MKRELDMSNVIVAAIYPAKAEAMDRAEKWARERMDNALAEIAAAGWDLNVCAPRPRSTIVSRLKYHTDMSKHVFYSRITKATWCSKSQSAPDIREKSQALEARYINACREATAEQYDAFVWKMLGKIGDATEAKLEGNHVWGYSFLTVFKPDNSLQVWKTQQILNVSKLGTLFNQWPSRKIKAAA